MQANNYVVKTHIWDEPRPAVFDAQNYLKRYASKPDDRETRATTLQIMVAGKGKPELTYSTEHGSVESSWDAAANSLHIRMEHNGPVELIVTTAPETHTPTPSS